MTLSIRIPAGEASSFVSIAVFDSGLVEAAQALGEGDAVSVTGRLELRTWTGKDGGERSGISITASKLERLEPPASKRKAPKTAPERPRRPDPEGDPFDADAGNLDAVLPMGGRGS